MKQKKLKEQPAIVFTCLPVTTNETTLLTDSQHLIFVDSQHLRFANCQTRNLGNASKMFGYIRLYVWKRWEYLNTTFKFVLTTSKGFFVCLFF